MSLGPAGASLDADKADNFEDVSVQYKDETFANSEQDGEAIRGQMCGMILQK